MGFWKKYVEKPINKTIGYVEDVVDVASDITNDIVDSDIGKAAIIAAAIYYGIPPEAVTSAEVAGAAEAGALTATEAAAAEAAVSTTAAESAAAGLSLSDALNYARAGLLVNAVTGDPLGLSGSGGGGGGNAPTGFAMVPIPEDWKSPAYNYTPVQEVKFEDLFPGVSLQGTQWQGMQGAQPNMTFNDIFASGMQQTPMGSPVDINQIVGSILGQNAKS